MKVLPNRRGAGMKQRSSGSIVQAPSAPPLAVCLALMVGLGPGSWDDARAAQAGWLDCMIQPNQIVQVGVPASGVVERLMVDRGDRVSRGQVLAQMSAGVEKAALAVAREKATQQAELSVADSAQAFARRELARASELQEQEFVSKTYLDKSRVELEVARGRSDQAQERRRLAQRELELAQAQLSQRTVRAPLDAVVMERLVSAGEFVDQKPILRLAELDPLRVEVLVPASAFGRVAVGARARIGTDLAAHSALEGVVRTVDGLIDAASNTFRVRLELANPGSTIPAGLRCRVDLGLGDPPAAATAATAATAPRPTGLGAAAVPALRER